MVALPWSIASNYKKNNFVKFEELLLELDQMANSDSNPDDWNDDNLSIRPDKPELKPYFVGSQERIANSQRAQVQYINVWW